MKDSLNIAMVCDGVTDCVAGSFISTLRFSELLVARGHKVIFITSKSPKNPQTNFYKQIKAYRFRSILLPKSEGQLYLSFPTKKEIKRILTEEHIDIVHVAIPSPNAKTSIQVARELGIKIVVHSHTQPENLTMHIPLASLQNMINFLFYKYLSWLYGKADALIFPTKFAQKLMSKLEAHPKSLVVSNGVDQSSFRPVPIEALFTKFNLSHQKKNILFVGRLHPEKSIETLIQAVPIMIKRDQSIHVLIAGFGHMDSELKLLAKKLNVTEHISFLGRLSHEELLMAYTAGDLFVLPSKAELEGMAVLEAMSFGKPIVIANSPQSASTYFVEGNGSLFEPGSSKDLAEKILSIVSDENKLKIMGNVSFEKSKQYNINESVTKLENLYHSLLKNAMQEHYLTERGIYYRSNAFDPNKKTVVFVHGVSGSSSAWFPYEKKFEEKYNIVSLDLRGHGKSKKYRQYSSYNISSFAGDVEAVVSSLNLDHFILVSHSFGVFVALEYMKEFGHRVEKVVFLSPNYTMKKRLASQVLRVLLLPVVLFPLLPFKSKEGIHIDYSKYRMTGDWNIRRTIADVSNTYFRVYLYSLRQMYSVDYEEFLSSIHVPTLIIHGRKDSIFPVKSSYDMSAKIKDATLVVLEKTDHIIVLNNFHQVSEEIEKFVEK
jgi:1,2-diacylglycerol 3-alpha-glucosyltransferase